MGVDLFERYYGTYTEELRPFVETMLHKRVVIALHVERTVSWDLRKLGLPSTRPALPLPFRGSVHLRLPRPEGPGQKSGPDWNTFHPGPCCATVRRP